MFRGWLRIPDNAAVNARVPWDDAEPTVDQPAAAENSCTTTPNHNKAHRLRAPTRQTRKKIKNSHIRNIPTFAASLTFVTRALGSL